MKFYLKLSENLLILFKIGVLKYYNWKGINVSIGFYTILLLNTNFRNCLNVFFLLPFLINFWWEVVFLNRICILIPSDLSTAHKFSGDFVE